MYANLNEAKTFRISLMEGKYHLNDKLKVIHVFSEVEVSCNEIAVLNATRQKVVQLNEELPLVLAKVWITENRIVKAD